MAVIKAPRRQQDYLTEYDRQMAQYLRQMGGSIGAQDIAAEAYGGKFPVGTMTAKILSGVLARASDKRAMNREERAKDSYGTAFEIANAQDRGLNLSTTDMSVSPEGNLEILPTNVERGGVSTFTRPETYGETLKNYKSSGIADEQFFEDREKISAEDALAAQFARDNLNKLTGKRVSGVEATTESPLGIPYAPRNVALTVGEPTGDSTQLGRYLSGTLEQDILPTNANKALSASLRGANIDEREFADYRLDRKMATMPKREVLELFDKNNNPTFVIKSYNPTTGTTTFNNKDTNELININEYSTKKNDISTKTYTVTNMAGQSEKRDLTNKQAANLKDEGYNVTAFDKSQSAVPYQVWAQEYVLKHGAEEGVKLNSSGEIESWNGTVLYSEDTFPFANNKDKSITNTDNSIVNENQTEENLINKIELEKKITEENSINAEKNKKLIENFKTTQNEINLQIELTEQKKLLKPHKPGSRNYTAINDNIKELKQNIKDENEMLGEKRSLFRTAGGLMRKVENELRLFDRDTEDARKLINTILANPDKYTPRYLQGLEGNKGTIVYKLNGLLESLKGRIAYGALQDMRNSNPTGGGVGALNEKELELFMTSAGVVDIYDLPRTLQSLGDVQIKLNQGMEADKEWYSYTFDKEWETK